jgi:hypothetical protein
MDILWTYRKNRYHENTNQQVARYKMEALDRSYDEIWEKHSGLIENLNYESKRCWVNMAEKYINEASASNVASLDALQAFAAAS